MGGNVTSVPQGFTEKQWKNLDPLIKKACEQDANLKVGIANALSKGFSISEINDHYRDNSYIKGLAVEKNDDGSVKVPPESTAAMLDDKTSRELLTEQWKAYYSERYTNNREEARHDMVRLLSHKEVKQLQNSFVDLWHATDDTDPAQRNASMRLKMKYVNENPAKMDEMDKIAQAYIEKYKDKLDDPQLITDYKQAFAPQTAKYGEKTNTVDITLTKITPDDLKALAQFKALNELPMTSAEIGMACEELAIKAIEDRHLNSGIAEYNDCQAQIEQLINENRQNPEIQKLSAEYRENKKALLEQIKNEQDTTKKLELKKQLRELQAKFNLDCDAHLPKDVQKKVKKLAEQANKAFEKANNKENEYYEKNIDKLVEIAAEAQISIEKQKHKYETTPPPKFDELPAEVQVLVTANPTMFCDEATDESKPTFTDPATGKKYVFNGEKYKQQMLAYSQAGRTSGKEQTNQEGCDYYCDIPESDQAFWGLNFGGLGDGKDTKRSTIKKAMEAAGITTEPDHTTQQRIAHVLKSAGIGALSGAGAVFVSDFLNTLRNIPGTEKIFELASLTKMIPFEVVDKIRIREHLSGDDATWNYQGHYSGDDATWNYQGHYSGDDATWNYQGHYSGDDATWTGSGDWTYDDVVKSHHSVTDYENGILAGHREWDEDIPVHGEGSITISGNNGHWEHDVNVSGNNGHWEHDVNVSGKNGHWEHDYEYNEDRKLNGEVENPDADRELYEQKGTKKRGFKFEFSSPAVYGYAAAGGAVAGTIKGLLSMNKIKDKGLRKNAETMRVVSQKETRRPTPPKPPKPPKIESEIKITPHVTPEKEEKDEKITTEKVDVKAPVTKGDKVYYQGWMTLQAAYGFKEDPKDSTVGKRFRNWFRKNFIDNGKDIWEMGTKKGTKEQHFEKQLEYTDPKTNKKYSLTFSKDVFETPIDSRPKANRSGTAPSTGNTKPNTSVTIRKIPGTETYSGNITVKIEDKTYTASVSGQTSEQAVKDALRIALVKQGLSDADVDKAIRNAKTT